MAKGAGSGGLEMRCKELVSRGEGGTVIVLWERKGVFVEAEEQPEARLLKKKKK